MSENYIVINGKKMDLTDEQLKQLGIEVRKNPFESVGYDGNYYYTDSFGTITQTTDSCNSVSARFQNAANYFNDEAFAKQVALHQLLYRKLLKFAYEQGYKDVLEWNCCNLHYRIHYTYLDNKFDVASNDTYKNQNAVYFATRNGALSAIKEVVEPFIKEHPEFVW